MNMVRLFFNMVIKFVIGVLFMAAFLFFSAGSLFYFNAWLFLTLLFLPMVLLGIILFVKAPNLLEKRLSIKEKEKAQKGVVGFSALLFLVGFLVAGFDFRFGWSKVPVWLVIIASVILIISYALYAEVMRENAYLSRTVEVQQNQKVVDSGLYAVIRHPMYAVTIWLFLSIPLVLGSWWALLCFLPYPIAIAVRIKNEEKVLENGLNGYKEYKQKVRWRLLPFVW